MSGIPVLPAPRDRRKGAYLRTGEGDGKVARIAEAAFVRNGGNGKGRVAHHVPGPRDAAAEEFRMGGAPELAQEEPVERGARHPDGLRELHHARR